MLGFIEFLEEIERSRQVAVIDPDQVSRLVARFGPKVRSMGTWKKTTDGSVEIPLANIAASAQKLGDRSLSEAIEQLKVPGGSSAAEKLIAELSEIHLRQFKQMAERFQESSDPAEVETLRRQILSELFE